MRKSTRKSAAKAALARQPEGIDVLAELAALKAMTVPELQEKWQAIFGERAPNASRGNLELRLGYRVQELIHGGLRYLEYYECARVREALGEREALWGIAPHIIRPMLFVLPHSKGLRPRWLLRLGLFLYDHMGGRDLLPPAKSLDLTDHVAGGALKEEFARGFAYSDCWVDDARLVVLNAMDARERGADVRTRTPMTGARRDGGVWRIDTPAGEFAARALVNAAGPAAADLLSEIGQRGAYGIRKVRGSHIVTRRLFDHDFSYIFQLPDGRIFFAIPYEQDFTLIGTTDADHDGSLSDVQASEAEIAYLCEGVNRDFAKPITRADVVWTYAGVRALVDEGTGKPEAATRGYRLGLSDADEGAPLLSVFGGKITTYRHLAEDAVDLLADRLSGLKRNGWTLREALPGGDFARGGVKELAEELHGRHPFLSEQDALRIARAYGTRAVTWLGGARTRADLGRDFGAGLSEAEVQYLVREEWARSAQDILWRRSKLGLHMSVEERDAVEVYIENSSHENRLP